MEESFVNGEQTRNCKGLFECKQGSNGALWFSYENSAAHNQGERACQSRGGAGRGGAIFLNRLYSKKYRQCRAGSDRAIMPG